MLRSIIEVFMFKIRPCPYLPPLPYTLCAPLAVWRWPPIMGAPRELSGVLAILCLGHSHKKRKKRGGEKKRKRGREKIKKR
jgi:hypothetical protein